jgi:hypothetical protein
MIRIILTPELRDQVGRVVQEEWAACAREMKNPPAAWLRGWDEVSEPMKEIDRRIGVAVMRATLGEGLVFVEPDA